jgi:hypothetical protein
MRLPCPPRLSYPLGIQQRHHQPLGLAVPGHQHTCAHLHDLKPNEIWLKTVTLTFFNGFVHLHAN